jgi:tRNA (Thr-GGU) A37 N-methylase
MPSQSCWAFVVRLLEVAGNRLRIAGVDVLNGTPLLDIKPYVPDWDAFLGNRIGWMENPTGRTLSDKRFAPG